MKDPNQELDELYEALTIQKIYREAQMPPQGGYIPNCWHWAGYQWPSKKDSYDTYYLNDEGECHRLYGPAYISTLYDTEIWYKDGEYHRVDGPAIRHRNTMIWYKNGKLHRLDGPAVVTGGGPSQYWIDGQKMSSKEYKKEIFRRRRKGLIK
jgi:hypothetical protein